MMPLVHSRLTHVSILGAVVALGTTGCSATENPSFPLSVRRSKAELAKMRSDPKPLERPLVILAGWGDPGVASASIRRKLEKTVDDERIVTVAFAGGVGTFDKCRAKVVERVEAAFESGDTDWTIEVDVVTNSMGGLIARHAAVPSEGSKALRIVRLLTISAPHQGAMMASVPLPSRILEDMRVGSEFLEDLNAREISYELVPYARLGDTWVGLENTAPPGEVPWWVPNRPFEMAHMAAFGDPRFIADIARRLRGETPYTTLPRAPFPDEPQRPPDYDRGASQDRYASREEWGGPAEDGNGANPRDLSVVRAAGRAGAVPDTIECVATSCTY